MKSVFPVPLYRKPGSIPNPLRSYESVVERQGAHFPAFRGIFQHEFDAALLGQVACACSLPCRLLRGCWRVREVGASPPPPARAKRVTSVFLRSQSTCGAPQTPERRHQKQHLCRGRRSTVHRPLQRESTAPSPSPACGPLVMTPAGCCSACPSNVRNRRCDAAPQITYKPVRAGEGRRTRSSPAELQGVLRPSVRVTLRL